MQKVERAFLPPGICFVCQGAPADSEDVVDTGRQFQGPAPTALDGRKYLCGACIRAAGEQIGLASDAAKTKAEAERDEAVGRLAALRDKFRAFADEFSQGSLEAAEAKAPVVAVAAAEAADAAEAAKPKKTKAVAAEAAE